ncbi:MAG: preprotein translocase subunit SecG [Clostridia bacterium]|nr:preprotein translocase subunit SecG [Clostridia bacterium]
MELIFGIVLLVMAVFLIVAVLVQSGEEKSLSGTIAGGADSFFGKSKANKKDKILPTLTIIVAVVFVLVVIAMFVFVG